MNVNVRAPAASSRSAEEQALRIELAAAYRLTAMLGMDDLVYAHLSARVPGSDTHFLLNPYGMLYEEITASSLIKVDGNGDVVEGNPDYPHNPTGFVIHSAVHRSGDDRTCVFHAHPIHAMAVSSLECGLLPMSVWAMQFYKRLSYHDYEGPPLRLDERDRILAKLGSNKVMLMKNHGVLTTGRTIGEAFIYMYYLEKSAQVQLMALSAGSVIIPPREVAEYSAQLRYSEEQLTAAHGELEWRALVRKLDRLDPSYRN